MDNALKALGETEDELIVGNHIVLFGGRDLTGVAIAKNADGSSGEYFAKSTELESEYTKTGRLYVDFEHGRDPDGVGNNKHNILGYVDWKSKAVDDDGVFVKRVLYRRNKYVKMLEPLIKAGLIGTSSEALPETIVKADNGEIQKWGLVRDTLTVTPMEPRMLDANALAAVKAMAEIMPALKSLIPSNDTALPVEDENKTKSNPSTKENTMSENQYDTMAAVEKAVADALAKRDEIEKAEAAKAAALKAAEEAAYKRGVEEAMKARKAPAYNQIPKGSDNDNEGVGAFKHWLSTGQVNGELIASDSVAQSIPSAKAAWNVTTGASGGFLVPDPLYNQIIAKRNIASWIRQAPVQMFSTVSDHLLVPQENASHTAFVLTAEAAAYDENEGTVAQKDLILYKYTKLTKVSEEFLMYNQTNWEAWFSQAMARAEAVTENTFTISGTGSSQPEGLAATNGSTASSLTIKTSAQLNPEDLTALIGKLGAGYNVPSECGFVGANASKWYLKNAILAGPFAYAGSQGTPAPDFFGYPFYVDDDVQSYTATSGTVLYFGNLRFFGVVEKPGMIIQRNPYLYMANGQVGIFASIFRGSGTLQKEAIYSVAGK